MQFQRSDGLLSILGSASGPAVSASLSSTGFIQLNAGGQGYSSDPSAAGFDAALAGVTGATLKGIQLDGNAAADHVILGNLNVSGGFTVGTDGILEVQGQLGAGGPIQLSGHAVLLSGRVADNGANGGSITVSADNVVQSGLLEANGSQGAGGSIQVDFTSEYLATATALTAANSAGAGSGGLIMIDGGSSGSLFTSGRYQATAAHGQGGAIDLFGQTVHLVGAGVNVSGGSGGGLVRVGGDSPTDIASRGGSSAGVSFANTTTVDATTTLTANALVAGNGGHVIVWSQQSTTFGGTLTAQGAGVAGQGGLLEVSSAGVLTYGGHASATASSGRPGRLLLDPKDLIISNSAGLPQFNLINPAPNQSGEFGQNVVVLSNGNVVVTDRTYGLVGISDTGAVYLYNGQTGALLSTLFGSTQGDEIGSGGVTALSNGNYVVSSPLWGNNEGAATWGNGSGGTTETVSASNSLVGSTSGDNVSGSGVTALTNGDYVVVSPSWQSGGAQVGAATWGDGFNGTTGQISATNSLVGSANGDQVGNGGVTALAHGNYVVDSLNWNNNSGAVTWGNGGGGTIGPVSAANSLVVGANDGGSIGYNVTALSNGNYVVGSPGWNQGIAPAGVGVGAATWVDGNNGQTSDNSNTIDPTNSLIGSTSGDQVGTGGVTALTNGDYVVSSPNWQSGGSLVGAVTWGNGTTGQTFDDVDVIDHANSLMGSPHVNNINDNVGQGTGAPGSGVVALANGNYVVVSPFWNESATQAGMNFGAVTWAKGDGSTVGTVSASNSLLGSTANDLVGFGGVTALSNGNYVVSSPMWQNGTIVVGAVTWANGTNGQTSDGTNVIDAMNSLMGSTNNDDVSSGGVTALSNGNYVVSSPGWQSGSSVVGAVTWGNGTTGIDGTVSALNSLVGSTTNDDVSSRGVTALSNGNYVVDSPGWQSGGNVLGAVTWGNGSTGIDGAVSTSNSLVGSTNKDDVGSGGVTALANGNYIVSSPKWQNGGSTPPGAATIVNGGTGQTLDGANVIDVGNSLIGPGMFALGAVAGLTGGTSFLAAFPGSNAGGSGGVVLVGQLAASSESFATAASQTLSLTPSFLTATLDTGTAVVLQANEDITLDPNSAIVVNNPNGPGGDLTLQAGRSIILNASITTGNGNLTLIANDTTADGVITADRQPGTGLITMGPGAHHQRRHRHRQGRRPRREYYLERHRQPDPGHDVGHAGRANGQHDGEPERKRAPCRRRQRLVHSQLHLADQSGKQLPGRRLAVQQRHDLAGEFVRPRHRQPDSGRGHHAKRPEHHHQRRPERRQSDLDAQQHHGCRSRRVHDPLRRHDLGQ